MFGIHIAMANVMASITQASLDRYEWEMIMRTPAEQQGALIRERYARKEKERLERREREMHDQLCESIEKAGENARPRGWEFY